MNSGQTCRPCRGSHVVLSPEGAVLVTSPGTKSSYPRPPQSLNPFYREKCLMRGPSNQVIKSDSEKFSSSRRVTRRQVMRHFTSNGIEQCQNGLLSNLLTPYRKQPRPTQIVVAYPRSAFSATKRTHHAPISFAQQVQVSQDAYLIEIRKNEIPRSMVMEALSWESRRASQYPVVQSPVHP